MAVESYLPGLDRRLRGFEQSPPRFEHGPTDLERQFRGVDCRPRDIEWRLRRF